jgi:hypothetical protein
LKDSNGWRLKERDVEVRSIGTSTLTYNTEKERIADMLISTSRGERWEDEMEVEGCSEYVGDEARSFIQEVVGYIPVLTCAPQ